ncbi:MAG: DNA replication and repair protein RecF, partial [Myxococcota bacterium]
ALLKNEGPNSMLDVFDQQLAEAAARVVQRRQAYLKDYVPVFRECMNEVSGGGLEGDLEYQSSIEGIEVEAFVEALTKDRGRDRARGTTSRGPHKDDIYATLNGKSARAFASQGQHRAFVLAMKIAEIRLLDQHLGYSPVLLLDDVSSELDEKRNSQLMSYLVSDAFRGQVFLTTTDRAWVRIDSDYSCFTIRDGVLEETQ